MISARGEEEAEQCIVLDFVASTLPLIASDGLSELDVIKSIASAILASLEEIPSGPMSSSCSFSIYRTTLMR